MEVFSNYRLESTPKEQKDSIKSQSRLAADPPESPDQDGSGHDGSRTQIKKGVRIK